ncbi:MAG: ATP-binding cassette domain-containing protein, partial [Armatimonadetes bacterium]|nr:ATP-binding cassette domain-containing protein [Armatimonadota bacterium]
MSAEKGNNIPILTQNLTKRYGRILALDNLCLRVEAGQVYGLLGPNGAGKTTTLRLLLGLARPTAGAAWLFGLPCGTAASRRPGVVGALVDEPAFYPYLTGRQNLEILCDLSGAGHDEIGEALAAVGLAHAADRLYQTYSHGMRQRLGIAAALVPRPRLLVLDEPAAGLDPQGLRDVRELLRRLAADGMTVLLSSHLLPEVQILCTQVGLMCGGRLVASGPVS